MAKLVQPAPKYVPPEWSISCQMKYANAEGERAAAERLVAESRRLANETDKTTNRRQQDNDKKLDQRLKEIEFWRKEVDDKLDGIKVETENLAAFHTRIEKAMEACREPLHIAQECLANRQRRQGIDLVHDDPEKELLKEVEVIQGILALLHRTKEQANEQIRLNKKAKYNLEKDLRDKGAAFAIDKHNAELRNNSAGLRMNPATVKINANSSTPDQWEDFSNDNILNAEKQRQNSEGLRSILDGVLQTTANDMLKQKECVDISLDRRIEETRQAKLKLEGHLAKVMQQITEVEDNISMLKEKVGAKEAPMALAKTRLENRTYRPSVELCRDTAQYGLVEEVAEISDNVMRLRERYAQSEESLKALIRRQLDLEDDIAVKANTLMIDEAQCKRMRQSINIQVY